MAHLRRCVELAEAALEDGDDPAPRVRDRALVRDQPHRRGTAQRDRLHVRGALPDVLGGARLHELGRIVYAVSTAQLMQWRTEWGVPPPRVAPLPIEVVAPGVPTT